MMGIYSPDGFFRSVASPRKCNAMVDDDFLYLFFVDEMILTLVLIF